MSGTFKMRNFHETAREKTTPYVVVVILVRKIGGAQLQVQSLHDTLELGANIIRRLKRALRQEVIIGPVLGDAFILLVCVVHIQQCQVVSVNMGKSVFSLVRRLASIWRSHENTRNRKHRCNAEGLIGTVVLRRHEENLGQLWIKRELAHSRPFISEVTIVVQSAKVIQQFERPHEGLRRRWIHEIEMHEIINSKLLQLKYNVRQVGTQNLRIRLFLKLSVESCLSV
mmetsp:Transcript_15659/g.29714  ORF Transcript_15659/g.29714 Transcript_15659/m.29714 type:complete len:227 (+) Transcript_15659:508-1188(+)